MVNFKGCSIFKKGLLFKSEDLKVNYEGQITPKNDFYEVKTRLLFKALAAFTLNVDVRGDPGTFYLS